MKIRLTFKTPDVLEYPSVELTPEELEDFKKLASNWVKYEENITVEIDTNTKTCVVIPCQ